MKNLIWFSVLALAVFLAAAVGSVRATPTLPDFGAATFSPGAPVNNTYFPLIDASTRIFEGEKEEDGEITTERFELTNLGPGPVILGVQTTVQRDRAFEDGLLAEDTFDYYAQDTAGNVWYFGEDVTNYIYDEDDNLIDTNSDSAWRAGVNGALPGYIMPADPIIDFNYYQEYAPDDDAVDQGTIFARGDVVSLDIGDFMDVLRILETTDLEPDAIGLKYFAPNIGLILEEEGLDDNYQNPELSIAWVGTRAVPEPATFLLLGAGMLGLFGLSRRKFSGLNAKRD